MSGHREDHQDRHQPGGPDSLVGYLPTPPAWTSWTPVLAANGGGLALGSGSAQQGRYVKLGSLVIARARVLFGTSGVAPGTGSYTLSLPVTANGSVPAFPPTIGSGWAFDSSTGLFRLVMPYQNSTTAAGLLVDNNTVGLGAAVPWVWAASDELNISLYYEAA